LCELPRCPADADFSHQAILTEVPGVSEVPAVPEVIPSTWSSWCSRDSSPQGTRCSGTWN